jgi:hypothetical protein
MTKGYYGPIILWFCCLAIVAGCKVHSSRNPTQPSASIAPAPATVVEEIKPTPMNPTPTPSPCDIAKQMILDRSFSQWQGLPTDCDWTSLTGPLPADWTLVPGRSMITAYAHHASIKLKVNGYYLPYFTYTEGRLILFDASLVSTPAEDAALLASLGEPEKCLTWQDGMDPMPATECVFAARGMTVFTNGDHSLIAHIALYPPCATAHYEQYLRPNLAKERLPKGN